MPHILTLRARLLRATLALAAAVALGAPLSAQTGILAGTVVDAEFGDPLIGVNVIVEDLGTTGAATDLDGRYRIPAVPTGTYTLAFSAIGFETQRVTGVDVVAGEVTTIDLQMGEDLQLLDGVTVEARVIRNNDAALLAQRAKAPASQDMISAESIGRSGSSTASDALQKVPGASVVGGKYVYVRGLGDRYMNAQLNGASLPSADPEKNAVPLDLFPAGLLDNIVTTKTFTPDQPGNFTGGSINIATRDFPEQMEVKVSTSTGFNTQATPGGDFLLYDGGRLGLFGNSGGVPDALQGDVVIPDVLQAQQSDEAAQQLTDLTRSFSNSVSPSPTSVPLNQSYGLSVGNQTKLFGRTLGYVASASYSRSATSYEGGTSARYDLPTASSTSLANEFSLSDTYGQQELLFGGLANLTYRLSPAHELGANVLYNRGAEASGRYQVGTFRRALGSNPDNFFETRVAQYIERSMLSTQLRGDHAFGQQGPRLNWTGTVTTTRQDEPDLRFFADDFTIVGADTSFRFNTAYPQPTRYFRDLSETGATGAADLDVPFSFFASPAMLKVGGLVETKDRTFRERTFKYRQNNAPYSGDAAAYFADANVGLQGQDEDGRNLLGPTIFDNSQSRNNYDGDQLIGAGYAMVDVPLRSWLRVIGGARFERTDIQVQSQERSLPAATLQLNDVLPSVGLVFQLRDDVNVRTSYGRTVARPTFRELAPYLSFEFIGSYGLLGNQDLQRTTVDNFDSRVEWFFGPGQLLAVSGFYKAFENPIEYVELTNSGNNAVQPQNVGSAEVLGLELEARKRFSEGALSGFQAGGNLTLVQSSVSLSDEEFALRTVFDSTAASTRQLQGQSPYVLNLDLGYQVERTGTTVNVFYNVFGERLESVGSGGSPDLYEQPRAALDFSIGQQFGRVRAKFSAKNILNDAYEVTQDFRGQEYVVRSYEKGRSFSLGLSFDL